MSSSFIPYYLSSSDCLSTQIYNGTHCIDINLNIDNHYSTFIVYLIIGIISIIIIFIFEKYLYNKCKDIANKNDRKNNNNNKNNEINDQDSEIENQDINNSTSTSSSSQPIYSRSNSTVSTLSSYESYQLHLKSLNNIILPNDPEYVLPYQHPQDTKLQYYFIKFYKYNYCKWFIGNKNDSLYDLIIPTIAEFIGSAIFIFIICSAAANTENFKGAVNMQNSLVCGFTITALCFTFGHISGGHFNFTVTFSFIFSGRISPMRGFFYFFAQFFGSLLGALLVKLLVPIKFIGSCYGATVISPSITLYQAFFLEFFLAFCLIFVVSAATDSQKNENQVILTPLCIGLCVYSCISMGLPFTGAGFNPTRSFAASAAGYEDYGCEHVWDNHAIYWFAPLIGGIVATYLYQFSFAKIWGENLAKLYKVNKLTDVPILAPNTNNINSNPLKSGLIPLKNNDVYL